MYGIFRTDKISHEMLSKCLTKLKVQQCVKKANFSVV